MERFSCDAILVSRTDFGEADRIVTFLTPDRGKISAFARGARKSRRRFCGVLEPCSLIHASFGTTRGKLFSLDDATLLNGFSQLRCDLEGFSRGAYACELAKELCAENADNHELFFLLKAFLEGSAGPEDLMCFELGALGTTGFRPGLDRCAICGASDGIELRFDPRHGGRLCSKCARTSGAHISHEALHVLAALQAGQLDAGRQAPSWIRAEARKTLTGYVCHLTGRKLKSFDFMQRLGIEA